MVKTNKQLSHNRHIILYAVVITLILLVPVNAETFNNSGFEFGDLTGWIEAYYYDGTKTVIVGTDYHNDSVYGAQLYTSCTLDTFASACVYQYVNLTGIDELSFDYKVESVGFQNYYGSNSRLSVSIGGIGDAYEDFSDNVVGNWKNQIVDVSGYSNNQLISWCSVTLYLDTTDIYLDNVLLDGEGTHGNSEIIFYPTETNMTPTHVNYSICSGDASNDYSLTIYRNVSGTSHYIDYVGWFHTEDGSAPISISEYGANCTYYARLYAAGIGYNRYIATCEMDYIYDGSGVDPFPTPQPTPDITPLPTFTPPPTPVPPDSPVSNNSLNCTWVAGYFSLVDSVMNGLFHPIFNFTGYLMHPMAIIMTGGIDFMEKSTIVFDDVEVRILIATGVLEIFFDSLPDKVVFTLLYYMVWVVILIIMKGAT